MSRDELFKLAEEVIYENSKVSMNIDEWFLLDIETQIDNELVGDICDVNYDFKERVYKIEFLLSDNFIAIPDPMSNG